MSTGDDRNAYLCDDELVVDELEQRLTKAWDTLERQYASAPERWRTAYQPLVEAARARPELRRLFPFTSHMRLCFSRCSDYPYTIDCPSVAADQQGYLIRASWVVSDPMPAALSDTADPEKAVQVVIDHLPTDRAIWIGSWAGG